jgi:hypothetical protein
VDVGRFHAKTETHRANGDLQSKRALHAPRTIDRDIPIDFEDPSLTMAVIKRKLRAVGRMSSHDYRVFY